MARSNIDSLANQVLQGKKDINLLLSDLSPHLFRFISSRAQSQEDAQDILQETLISISQSLALWSGKKSILNFAYGIAKHEISDFYLKQKWRALVIRLGNLVVSSTLDIFNRLEKKDILLRLFARLPL